MPSFFAFQQGSESRGGNNDSSPLLGRFRAVPPRSHRNSILGFSPTARGLGFTSGYGAIFGHGSESGSEGEGEEGGGKVKKAGRLMRDLWLEPKQAVVTKAVERWWNRWFVLAVLPAALVSCKLFAQMRRLWEIGLTS